MQINVNFDQPTSTLPIGFVTAVNWAVDYLDSLFTNPVTVTINVGYGEVAGGSLGGALGGSGFAGGDRPSHEAGDVEWFVELSGRPVHNSQARAITKTGAETRRIR